MKTAGIARDIREGDDRWLVLLHGLQSCRKIYSDFVQHPHFRDYSILALDFIGFGESEKPQDFSYELRDQGDAVYAVIKELGIKKFTLICHSFSGTVATLMLEKYGDSIQALVSMEGNLILDDSTHSHLIADKPLAEASRFWEVSREKMKTDIENSGPLRYEWTKNTPNYVFYKTSQSIVEHTKSGRLLKVFEDTPQPKLLVLGDRGSFVSRPKSEAVQLATIPNSGHFMITDNPKDTFESIHSFIRR